VLKRSAESHQELISDVFLILHSLEKIDKDENKYKLCTIENTSGKLNPHWKKLCICCWELPDDANSKSVSRRAKRLGSSGQRQ
jgi:hypothetical protein